MFPIAPESGGGPTKVDPFVQLVEAIDGGKRSEVEHWLQMCDEKKIDISKRKVTERKHGVQLTVLGYAVMSKSHPEVLRILLSRADNATFPLLHLAAYAGNIEAVTLLCDTRGINLGDKMENIFLTTLHMAVKGGDPKIVGHILQRARQLLSSRFAGFLNEKDNLGMTALHHAAWENHEEIASLLLQYEDAIEVNAQDSEEFTALHLACWKNNLGVVNKLLAHPLIDPLVHSKRIRLMTGELQVESNTSAIRSGQGKMAVARQGTLQEKEESLPGSSGGDTVLKFLPRFSSRNTRLEVEKRLDSTGRQGKLRRQEEYLLGCSDRIGRDTLDGYFPASMSLIRGGISQVEKRFICPDMWNDRITALHCASFAGHSEVVRALVQAISDKKQPRRTLNKKSRRTLNAVDDQNMSPLHYAVIRGDVVTVEELSKKKKVKATQEAMDINVKPLDLAAILLSLAKDKNPSSVREYEDIISVLSERDDVRRYLNTLYKDRQVFVDAANAILIGAVLIASIAFVGWLQPPLGYRPYYETRFLQTGAAPPATYDSFAAVGQSASVEVFWVFNSLSFFFAIATMLAGAGAMLPTQAMIGRGEVEHIRTLLIRTSLVFSASVFFVLGAFVAAGFASIPPEPKNMWGMIVTTVVGGGTCLVVLYYYFRRLLRLFRFHNISGGFSKQVGHALRESMGHRSRKYWIDFTAHCQQ